MCVEVGRTPRDAHQYDMTSFLQSCHPVIFPGCQVERPP